MHFITFWTFPIYYYFSIFYAIISFLLNVISSVIDTESIIQSLKQNMNQNKITRVVCQFIIYFHILKLQSLLRRVFMIRDIELSCQISTNT